MKDIISLLDYDSLLKFDEYISKFKRKAEIPFEANHELLKLKNKTIIVYQNFIMINSDNLKMLEKNFPIPSNCQEITYLSHINGDIFIMNKNKNIKQHYILFGNVNSKSYSFDIRFIFDYENSNLLKKELKVFMNNEIREYIINKTLFNDKNDSDIISPIFDNDYIIGYCYKYYSNRKNQYLSCNDYYDSLLKAIKLYFYFQEFAKKIKETKNYEKEYYLINRNLMSEIKINYKYNQIKEILDSIDIKKKCENSNNKIILAIKYLPNDIIKYFKENNEIKNKYEIEFFEPDIIPINDYKTKKSFMIYDKFELLEKEIAEKLNDEIKEKENLKCEINGKKILIHYPENFNGNDKCVSVIGQLNDKNQFLCEYILIYNDSKSQSKHIFNIKGKINKYLSSLQLYENSSPIIDENYNEIGTIIKYNTEIYNNDQNIIKENIKDITDISNNSNQRKVRNSSSNKKNENGNNINKKILFNKSINNIDEYNLDYQTDSPEIKDNFAFHPKIGLQNVEATYFMNEVLQCFCNIEKFVNYFKYSHHVIDIVRNNKNNLASSFKLLIEKLWPNNYNKYQKYYAPEEFKNKISKLNHLFKGIITNDARDLVNFIIITLHKELNKANKSNIKNNNINLDQRNQQIMFNNFAQNFILENQSIISDLFYGINCNLIQCNGCNTIFYNYQIYFFIEFPLEEVLKFKNNNNSINIYDCFDYDRKINLTNDENIVYCNYCKNNCFFRMCTYLTTGPEILILLFNKGQKMEFNAKFNFIEDLNLYNYIEYKNTGFKYKLISVITYIYENGIVGFVAYCKDPISKTWNKYKDEIVSVVEDLEFQSQVIKCSIPYFLFYQKS